MASSSHQITQRDVTLWGVAALVCGALAVLAGNLGGAMPPSLMAHLHGTRASGASFEQMQALLAQTRQQTAELVSANDAFESRLEFMDRSTTEMIRRVAAVETSVPLLIEALPFDADIDRSLLTAAITGDSAALQEVEGGLMALSRRPLLPEGLEPSQPIPPALDPLLVQDSAGDETAAPEMAVDPTTTASIPDAGDQPAMADPSGSDHAAIALGPVPNEEAAITLWAELGETVGPLLLGLEPRLADAEDGARLIAGPFVSDAAAITVCDRLALIGRDCDLTAFEGAPLSAP